MKCSKCGGNIKEEMRFCPNCGEEINKPKKHQHLKLISTVLIVICLIIVVCGFLSLATIKSPQNIKEIQLTFTGNNGKGKASLNKAELKKHGLNDLVNEKEFKYEIKPSTNLKNGQKVELYIKNDGIFGKSYHLKYKVKGLKAVKTTKVDKSKDNSKEILVYQASIDKVMKNKKIVQKNLNQQVNNKLETKIASYVASENNKNYLINVVKTKKVPNEYIAYCYEFNWNKEKLLLSSKNKISANKDLTILNDKLIKKFNKIFMI